MRLMSAVVLIERILQSMSDLVFSLVELPRALGSTLTRDIVWVTPDDLGTSSMAASPGVELPLEVTLTSVDDGVLAQINTEVTLHGECVRCLDPVERHHDVRVSEVFFEPAAVARFVADDDEGVTTEDDFLTIGERNTIDLEVLLRDSIVTLVDSLPLCAVDCEGLCPDCGEKWADLPADHAHEVIDPRMAGLAALLESGLLTDSKDA